jgi:uncharacterized protein
MCDVAVFAKAPLAGYAKTRLIPSLGAEGAAALQHRLTERAVRIAVSAALGRTTLWCAPGPEHPSFQDLQARFRIRLVAQPRGDLGARMLAAFAAAAPEGVVLIGSDCPSLEPGDLRQAADALATGADVAISPAEDGGYGLIAARRPFPVLFENIPWSTPAVASVTRERAAGAGLKLVGLRRAWDVDTPADYARLVRSGLLGREKGSDASTAPDAQRFAVATGEATPPSEVQAVDSWPSRLT